MHGESTKRCTHCGVVQPRSEFSPGHKSRDGLASWCRACCRERHHATKALLPCPSCGGDMAADSMQCKACVIANRVTRLCSVPDCGRKHAGRGLCSMHYARHIKRGDVGPVGPLRPLAAPRGSGSVNKTTGYRYLTIEGRQVLEHRMVMETALGRPLEAWETVHHRNGVRHDNRPENLEVWLRRHPAGQRVEDLVAFVAEHYPEAVEAALDKRAQLRLIN